VCKKSGESVDHFLLHCDMASALWNTFFSLVGLAWVMPCRVVDLSACWKGLYGRWSPLCVMWCLWRERNFRCFEDRERKMEDLKNFFSNTLYLWTATFDSSTSIFHVFLELFSSSS
jgi:hypothetical protein